MAQPEDFEFPPPVQTRGMFLISLILLVLTVTTQMSSFGDMEL